jgi:hypothetical protein
MFVAIFYTKNCRGLLYIYIREQYQELKHSLRFLQDNVHNNLGKLIEKEP